ncbi:30S ribosomal protein S9 [Candidatus Gottesmanbacteria bacterium]|nr:30S ribosomal protein S9 [Candidatus Gottesmanbacteria bacterium]
MPKKSTKVEIPTEKDTKKHGEHSYYEAIGRRKEAIARVRLYVASEETHIKGVVIKKGEVVVNSTPVGKYFPGDVYKKMYLEPFQITGTEGRFAVSAIISGGGLSGQVGAFRLGVSRALEKLDKEKHRPTLKKAGFLTRDSRAKERRKAGFAQKARARKQSPKR